ncbi:MAG: tRNA (adenosine(37)-N6)-threonylcarbamoyltransferase complex ATPase subunit type 1 TsaE [Candidatus Pacebacteria bacterium]|nr:tRNA (adenosine(37)-N6)-threonylcarbamoyltransferase complex ATPase subunit type 1 TsaE [Candidatus Paceibacterota bacterium]
MKVSEAEMYSTAAAFVASLSPGNTATVITLSGELGAGKTTFTQGIAKAFGVEETVSSPTFVLEKIYALPDGVFTHLIHIDAYRLKDEHELEGIGWSDILSVPGNLIVLEWPERVPALVPTDAINIRFDIEGDERIITITYGKESTEESPYEDS